jgi:transketolase
MELRCIYVLTHDSIGLGEDGPTHQPVEHLASLRAIPNLDVWRPCDAAETAVAWQQAIERTAGPTCLVLSRQNLTPVERTPDQLAAIGRGGYIVYSSAQAPQLVMMATGSEVALALAAAQALESRGFPVRVVSMPCIEAFGRQDLAYREHVLPAGTRRLAIEAGASVSWWRYVGAEGHVHGIDRFGQSSPGKAVLEAYGFTVESVSRSAEALLAQ